MEEDLSRTSKAKQKTIEDGEQGEGIKDIDQHKKSKALTKVAVGQESLELNSHRPSSNDRKMVEAHPPRSESGDRTNIHQYYIPMLLNYWV